MTKEDRIRYWLESAKDDWEVAGHLFEKGDYPYSLFFGHLTVEKILKAMYVVKFNEPPPYTHRLVHLTERVLLDLSEEQLELLETITDFNMEGRYPDEKFSFKKKCTKDFTEGYLKRIEEIKEWLSKKIPQ